MRIPCLALLPLVSALAAVSPDAICPTPQSPFVQPSDNGRLELHRSVWSYMDLGADRVTAHPAAKDFPGSVNATERVTRSVAYDANLITRWDTTAGNVPNRSTSPEAWQDTGLYAAPGETIVIQARSLPPTRKVQVIIGCHRDNLLNLAKWERFPVITRVWTLKAGENRVANAFGGTILIKVSAIEGLGRGAPAASAPEPLVFANAVVAPTYTLGKDDAASWALARQSPAPWGVLTGRRAILHVPSAFLRELDEPRALLEWWDRVIDLQDDLIALDRLAPERVVPDAQISAGFMHSGYPFMCQLKASGRRMVDVATLTKEGDWGFFHELGHNHQRSDWTFPGQTEVTNNLFSLICMEKIVGLPTGQGHGALRNLDRLMARRLGSPPEMGPFEQLAPFIVLIRAHGWEPLRATLRSYRDQPARKAGDTSVPSLQSLFVLRYGQAAKVDVSDFFGSLGYHVSDECRAALRAHPAFSWPPQAAGR